MPEPVPRKVPGPQGLQVLLVIPVSDVYLVVMVREAELRRS
jgi:hypothetical protein